MPATAQATDNSARALVTLLQLGRRARDAKTPAELGFVMVNETLQLLHYRQAALWLNTGLGGIAAVSGAPNPEANAPYIQWLGQVARNLNRAKITNPMPLTSADLPEALAVDWANWLPEQALWLPLVSSTNEHSGGLLLARDAHWSQPEQTLAQELTQVYQHALEALSPKRTWLINPRQVLQPTRTRVGVALAVLAMALFPLRLSVLAPAEVTPFEPFLVRAPLDGVVETIFVRPNQEVAAQTPLFSLDTTVLQSQHALAQEAYNTAEEEYRQAAQLAVTDDKSKLEMALRKGALAEKSVELDYTAQQLGRVQVKAERAGIAVFNDINDWQGKAVVLGEKILLLAAPTKVELTIDLPATDIIDLEPGAKVTLYPNANPTATFDARVKTLSYHAELTPLNVLAYRVKAQLISDQPLPRIGMMGTAKMYGGRVPLIYYVLRKPLVAARQYVGW